MTSPRIRALDFHGLRSLLDVRLELGSRLSVLMGKNGSGKTSVLSGAHCLSQLVAPDPIDYSSHVDGVAARVFRGERELDLIRTRNSGDRPLRLAFETSAGRLEAIADEECGLSWTPRNGDTLRAGTGKRGEMDTLLAHAGHLGGSVSLRLDAGRAARPSTSEDEIPRVDFDGSGLASALAWLAVNERDAFDSIEQDLSRIVRGAKKIKVPRIKIDRWEARVLRIDDELVPQRTKRTVAADQIELEFASAGFLPASQLSEGTVLVLTLLTVLHAPSCPSLVLLDDIDRALHPSAQLELIGSIRRLLDTNPNLQIIATSHAPYLMDALEPHEVFMLALDHDGRSHARRLDQHPKAAAIGKGVVMSEFWSAMGEDWVLEAAE